MAALEAGAERASWRRMGLAVPVDERAAPARALYRTLGYRFAHGPEVTSAALHGDEGPIVVGAVLTYLVKDV